MGEGKAPNVLNRFEFDLNLFAEPNVQIEVRDQLTLQLLYTGKLDNVGSGLHKLDISFTPVGGMVDFRIVLSNATQPMGVDIDNFILSTPLNPNNQVYLEDYNSMTTGTWVPSGTALLTYDMACGCMKIQTSVDGEHTQDQAFGVGGGQEYYLSMDVMTDANVATQIDVLDAVTLRPLTSKVLLGVGVSHKVTLSFNALSPVYIRATRVNAPGTAAFRIDNIEINDYQHFLSSQGGLSMNTTTDYAEWSATGGLADFKTYLQGNYQLEIRNHNASYVSTMMNTVQSQATELTFDLDRRGTISGQVAVVVINPANNGTLASEMVSASGLTQLTLNFVPPGTTVELRLYNPGDYALVDNLHLKYDRVVYHTICDNSKDYRFGFNGMEKDNERSGLGSSYTSDFRQLDTRLGRWFSSDKLSSQAPDWSPYRSNFDNPIYFVDQSGLFETRYETMDGVELFTSMDGNNQTVRVAKTDENRVKKKINEGQMYDEHNSPHLSTASVGWNNGLIKSIVANGGFIKQTWQPLSTAPISMSLNNNPFVLPNAPNLAPEALDAIAGIAQFPAFKFVQQRAASGLALGTNGKTYQLKPKMGGGFAHKGGVNFTTNWSGNAPHSGWSKGVMRGTRFLGKASLGFEAYNLLYDYSDPNVSQGRFAYRLGSAALGYAASAAATSSWGGPAGFVVGAGVGLLTFYGEKSYDKSVKIGSDLNFELGRIQWNNWRPGY